LGVLECGDSTPLSFFSFWSAAARRRFLSFFVFPVAKAKRKKAASSRRTPKKGTYDAHLPHVQEKAAWSR
jgi:hypothetical protein